MLNFKFFIVFFLGLTQQAHASSGLNWITPLEKSLNTPNHVLTAILVAILLLILGLAYRAIVRGTPKPVIPDPKTSFRNIIEAYGEFIHNLAVGVMGEENAKRYFSYYACVFLYILGSNLIGLVPGFATPSEDFNTAFALGIFTFFYYNFQGIKVQGLWGHIKHFMGPVWYMAVIIFPIEIFSHLVRPLVLGLRLKGNIQGDHAVLAVFSDLVPYLVPIPFYLLGLFVAFMQAFVFTILTMVYISLATEVHDHGPSEAEAH